MINLYRRVCPVCDHKLTIEFSSNYSGFATCYEKRCYVLNMGYKSAYESFVIDNSYIINRKLFVEVFIDHKLFIKLNNYVFGRSLNIQKELETINALQVIS